MIAKRVCPLFEYNPKAVDKSENCGSCFHYRPDGTVTDSCHIKSRLIEWIKTHAEQSEVL